MTDSEQTQTEQSDSREGWSDLGGQARKFHYFPSADPGTIALCGKWAINGGWAIKHPDMLQADNGQASSMDCVACRRKLDSRS